MLLKLFTVGVSGWLLGELVIFGLAWPLSHPESFASAMIWTISRGWIGFLAGLALLIGYGFLKGLPVARAALAYVLPAALLAALGGICLLVYPDNMLREELLTYLPVVLLFYGLGIIWLRTRLASPAAPAMACAVVPGVVGGLVILGFVTVPVFSSDAFRYRDAFHLTVSKSMVKEGALHIDGSIEIRKPGNYRFAAPRYIWGDFADTSTSDSQIELGEIAWGSAGEPKSSATGVFPMTITWRKGVPKSGVTNLSSYEDLVSIEVRNPDDGEKVIYSMSVPMYGQ